MSGNARRVRPLTANTRATASGRNGSAPSPIQRIRRQRNHATVADRRTASSSASSLKLAGVNDDAARCLTIRNLCVLALPLSFVVMWSNALDAPAAETRHGLALLKCCTRRHSASRWAAACPGSGRCSRCCISLGCGAVRGMPVALNLMLGIARGRCFGCAGSSPVGHARS